MFFGDRALVTELDCYRVFSQKKNAIFVHGRPYYSLSYRFSGQTVLVCGGERLISGSGTLTYVPKGVGYVTEVPEAGKMIVAHFDLIDAEAPKSPMVLSPADGSAFAEAFLALGRQSAWGARRDPKSLSLFYGILASLKKNESSNFAAPPRLLAIKEYFDRRLSEVDLGVSGAAEHFGISESYLRRIFREHFGVAPSVYIKKSRLKHAKILLQTGYYTVGEVAALCGFENLSYFSAEFHRLVGCSPREYIHKK